MDQLLGVSTHRVPSYMGEEVKGSQLWTSVFEVLINHEGRTMCQKGAVTGVGQGPDGEW